MVFDEIPTNPLVTDHVAGAGPMHSQQQVDFLAARQVAYDELMMARSYNIYIYYGNNV